MYQLSVQVQVFSCLSLCIQAHVYTHAYTNTHTHCSLTKYGYVLSILYVWDSCQWSCKFLIPSLNVLYAQKYAYFTLVMRSRHCGHAFSLCMHYWNLVASLPVSKRLSSSSFPSSLSSSSLSSPPPSLSSPPPPSSLSYLSICFSLLIWVWKWWGQG